MVTATRRADDGTVVTVVELDEVTAGVVSSGLSEMLRAGAASGS